LNLAALFCTLRALVRWVLPGRWTAWRESIFLLLALLGSVRMLWSGQSNPLVFALVGGGVVAASRQRWWWAALLLAMPVHIKVWPIAAALLVVVCRPRQLAWRFAVSLLGVAAVPFLTKPAVWVCQQYYAWYELLTGAAQIRHSYRDAWTIWELIHRPVDPHGYLLLQAATAVVVLGLCWKRSRLRPLSLSSHPSPLSLWERGRVRARRQTGATGPASCHSDVELTQRSALAFVLALWAGWQLVFGPGTERNTFGLIAPLSAWGLLSSLQQRRGRLLMGTAFLLMTASTFGVIERTLAVHYPAVLAAHPLGVLLFLDWLLRWGAKLPADDEVTLFAARAAAPPAAIEGFRIRGSRFRRGTAKISTPVQIAEQES
jgi:hypothetical protein